MASHWCLGCNSNHVVDLPTGWISSGTRSCQSLYRHPLGTLFHPLAHVASIDFALWEKTSHLDSHRTWQIGLKTISPYRFRHLSGSHKISFRKSTNSNPPLKNVLLWFSVPPRACRRYKGGRLSSVFIEFFCSVVRNRKNLNPPGSMSICLW